GGSIAGFGQDEKFDDAALTLLDMKKAFDEAGLAQNKLEFLGFDACLMATVEMAVLAADYAKFLIAAEDLEPGEGWNYFFLSALNDKKNICGFEMGKIIVDSFFEYFEEHELTDEEILTLSVVDLANAAQVMDAMGVLTQKNFSDASFKKMAARRATTKTFGEGSPRDNFADMVDVGDMAVQLADLFPREAAEVMRALENCVVYNRHNSETEIFGLSTYYIYGGKSEGVPSLRTYSDLEMSGAYTEFLHEFFKNLLLNHDGENIFTEFVLWEPRGERCGARCAADFENASQPFEQRLENSLSCVEKNFSGEKNISREDEKNFVREKNISREDEKNFVREKNILRMMSLVSPPENELLFPKISAIPCGENARRDDGEFVTLFPVSSTRMASMYAIPIFVNDHEADIIVAFSRKHPHGKIKGIRHNSANVFQKGYDPICETDVISFFRLEYDFENIRWTKSEPFSFDAPPSLSWHPAPEFFKTGLRHTDIFNNVTYSVF
ncbi:MAG: clostripain-related cysteine peptidase, partial [Defluviitaleaceae bacterium]|nr:clostripain-related cysteine peptidase [Defluviitaleaceae bacterium]